MKSDRRKADIVDQGSTEVFFNQRSDLIMPIWRTYSSIPFHTAVVSPETPYVFPYTERMRGRRGIFTANLSSVCLSADFSLKPQRQSE